MERCECSCGCNAPATTVDEGVPTCADCAVYYTTPDGEVVCSREQTSDDPCRHCGTEIDWGPIQTTGPRNWMEGRCACRNWRQEEFGPCNWVLSENPTDDEEYPFVDYDYDEE